MPSAAKPSLLTNQLIPLAATSLVCVAGVGLVYEEISLLNQFFSSTESIALAIRWPAVLIGLTIYLKTAIDFAIFIGRLMTKYEGWKNRILIESGTALGNIAGTLMILLIWALFREVKPLLA